MGLGWAGSYTPLQKLNVVLTTKKYFFVYLILARNYFNIKKTIMGKKKTKFLVLPKLTFYLGETECKLINK